MRTKQLAALGSLILACGGVSALPGIMAWPFVLLAAFLAMVVGGLLLDPRRQTRSVSALLPVDAPVDDRADAAQVEAAI